MAAKRIRIDTGRGFYPIVYVRGFAATAGEREETFYDTYYGYAATAVEKRDGVPPNYLEPIVFEGQLIRLLKEYGYVDAANGGLALAMSNPANLSLNPQESYQSMAAFIAATSRGDIPTGSIEYETIFVVGFTLFVLTLLLNVISIRLVNRFRQVYE